MSQHPNINTHASSPAMETGTAELQVHDGIPDFPRPGAPPGPFSNINCFCAQATCPFCTCPFCACPSCTCPSFTMQHGSWSDAGPTRDTDLFSGLFSALGNQDQDNSFDDSHQMYGRFHNTYQLPSGSNTSIPDHFFTSASNISIIGDATQTRSINGTSTITTSTVNGPRMSVDEAFELMRRKFGPNSNSFTPQSTSGTGSQSNYRARDTTTSGYDTTAQATARFSDFYSANSDNQRNEGPGASLDNGDMSGNWASNFVINGGTYTVENGRVLEIRNASLHPTRR